MPIFSELVSASAVSAGASDTWGTVGTVTLRPKPGQLIGAWVNCAPNAATAAEAYLTQVRFSFGELKLKELLVTGPCVYGENVATNSTSPGAGAADLHPLAIPFQGNEKILIEATHHACGTPTPGMNIQAGLLYMQGERPPPQWWDAFPGLVGASGSDSEANAAVTADDTALTKIEIPSIAGHIIGYACAVGQDAAPRTAEDLVLGIDFGTSTFPDFSPQQFPFVWKIPNLGTATGSGVMIPKVTWPTWFPLPGVSGDITPKTIVNTTMTDSHAVSVDVYYSVL